MYYLKVKKQQYLESYLPGTNLDCSLFTIVINRLLGDRGVNLKFENVFWNQLILYIVSLCCLQTERHNQNKRVYIGAL